MTAPTPTPPRTPLLLAFALALAAAVSLGLARFSYALLLPPMRAELHWSYFTAGAMNTANAAGYLLGALLAPRWFARFDALRVLAAGGLATAAILAAHAFAGGDAPLVALRTLAGVASAASFVGGGLLATRLSARAPHPGVVIGIYYGGAGLGILASTAIVPPLPWREAWIALGALSLACTLATWGVTRASRDLVQTAPDAVVAKRLGVPWMPMAMLLAGYLLFGVGYIGYMTFIVTLLREQGIAPAWVAAFYGLLGAGAVASSWIWAGVLQRFRGGQSLALLNAILALATLLPVISAQAVVVALSCLLFGCTFLSVVASTTAFVRHNLPPATWAAGIGAFTIVFALGQILGPSLIGRLADGPGGLQRGFVCSAIVLALGALCASRQRPLKAG
ncbi:YbfB/YjiJ family MFS transporter [Scleromatobacter humisilvae]|uniref:YbfB/YjiJ family MFS transporter n=1 Tax=Scleromatobacter humisilvae TaxID=2897159 RepID=A0A9X1YJF5_9BURK|nr:YbfB/YjiJ family MFS transporter [Scleromatobacter humisilvae]MCK9686520.1 YbfB/YjiJ family MFS transporter [Scleromatobacter humisilvae]